jgi:hypothetical protein
VAAPTQMGHQRRQADWKLVRFLLDALRAYMKRNYDCTLIDSRNGLSDNADICTAHMPDVVITCFILR